jgi:anaerobic carbon-monoxide dehydrogenase iron sulfur subunit
MNVVYVELDRCIACLSCERACLFQQADRNMGWSPNIFVRVDMDQRRIYAGTCLQCETALCLEVCPVNAIKRDPETSAVIVDKEICLGCGMCVSACPFGYMHLDDSLKKAVKCDLCGGDPKCVQMCMAKALHFGSINSLAERKRKRTDLRLGLRAVPVHKGEEK